MKWTILFLFLPFHTLAQECDELLKFKAEEYYINVPNKPDSLNQLSCKLIQRQLEPGSVFIDISESEMNHQLEFIVLVIGPKGEPEVIEIPIKQDANKNTQQATSDLRGGKTQSSGEEEVYSLADYKNFWSFIEPTINGAHKIYYSCSRLLNLVNLKFIKDNTGQFLFNNYDMVRLHSGASFLGERKRIILPRKMDVLLVGGLRYDCKAVKGSNWDYLPGTRTEINDIRALLSKSHYVVTIDSCMATEAKINATINAARFDVVHIATHGFYFQETEKNFGVKPDTYPMERGGIVLSGGNSKSATIDIFNQEGLFTAMEMQQLNLSNIRFMVLSTCHSGEGDASENTAPLGMTLAMMRNGIQAMMVSNRAVPDKETSLFMKTFYGHLASNGDLDRCYMLSIRELNEKFPDTDWSFFDLVH